MKLGARMAERFGNNSPLRFNLAVWPSSKVLSVPPPLCCPRFSQQLCSGMEVKRRNLEQSHRVIDSTQTAPAALGKRKGSCKDLSGFFSEGGPRHSLTKSSRNDVNLMHNSITLPNPSTPGSIQSYSMDFIHKGQGTMFMGYIT